MKNNDKDRLTCSTCMYCKIEKVKSFGRRYYCTLFLKDNTIGKRLKSEPIKNIPCDEYDEIIGYAITVDF